MRFDTEYFKLIISNQVYKCYVIAYRKSVSVCVKVNEIENMMFKMNRILFFCALENASLTRSLKINISITL